MSGVARRGGRLLCTLALAGLLVAGWVLAASRSAASRSWMSGPLHGLGARLSGPDYRVAVIALGVCYLVVIACAARGLLGPGAVIVTIVLASGLFAISAVPPAQDLFTYLGFGRLAALHGINPYAHGLAAAPGDPVFALAVPKWRHGTTPYGPLFTLMTVAVALLPVAAAAWTLKCLLWLTTLGCVVVVALMARALGRDGTRAAAFVGLNPAVLIYICGKGHNDAVMMLPLLSAMLLLVRERRGERAAGAAAMVAVAVKFTAAAVLPFLAIAAADRRRIALGIAAGGLVIAAITYAAFGFGPLHVLSSARRDQGLVHGDFSVLGLIGKGLGQTWPTAAKRWGVEIFGALYLLLLAASLRRPREWIRWSGWAMVALLATSVSLWPWYLLWLLPFAALVDGLALPLSALALTAVSLALQL